jgi:hypothetical protein
VTLRRAVVLSGSRPARVRQTVPVLTETGAGYEPQAWESFAVAEVGAAAALAGLLVVAASINIARILEYRGVTARLGGTLALFTGVLAIGTELLVPGVERVPLGIIMTVTGLALGLIVVRFSGINVTERQYRKPTLLTAGIAILATLLLTVSGASLALGAGGGLYWLAPGVLVAFAIGLVNAWVALVEILR